MTDESDGTRRPVLPLGLSLKDIATIPLVTVLIIIGVTLYQAKEALQAQLISLAVTCGQSRPLQPIIVPTIEPDTTETP